MFNLRFFIGWIACAITMYAAFYLWHGVLSTDFYRIQFPKTIFLVLAGVAYFVISYVLYKVYELNIWNKITENLFLKGVFSGVALGFILFSITTVLGVGFSQGLSAKIMVVDLCWQMLEQTIGGIIIAFAHLFIFVPAPEAEEVH